MARIQRNLLSLVFVGLLFAKSIGDLLSVAEKCCQQGTQWYQSSRGLCKNSPMPAGIQAVDQMNCRAIIEVCCLNKKQENDCENGKKLAKRVGDCMALRNQLNVDDQQECCNCCKLGSQARDAGISCDPRVFGVYWGNRCNYAYLECCDPTLLERGDETLPSGDNGTIGEDSTGIGELRSLRDIFGGGGLRQEKEIPVDSNETTTKPVVNATEPGSICSRFPGQLCDHICESSPGAEGASSYKCRCHPGFQLQVDGRTCKQAINEGSRCNTNNPCEHECIDTGLAIACKCFEGYLMKMDEKGCEDIDECLTGQNDCRPGETCVNNPGGYVCEPSTGEQGDGTDSGSPLTPQCNSGYAFNTISNRCEDIDECIIGTHSCTKDHQVCRNTQGSHLCQCEVGYEFNPSIRECEDVNECASNRDNCRQGQTCENTVGSFICRRSISCGTGYTLDRASQRCTDDDECKLRTHNCGLARECRNTPGSFRCIPKQCPQGYRLDYSTGACDPVECSRGFTPDRSGNCIDLDECVERPQVCTSTQQCINSIGSYKCRNLINCGSGYELNSQGNRCTDIDECERNTHDCKGGSICRNRPGTYVCQCPEGYRMNQVLNRCEDVDECERYDGQVCATNAECQNTPGSYSCICKDGFENSGRRICKDIDECERPGMCQHECRNTWGSFQCTCFDGYQLSPDGRTCQDIDECKVWGNRGRLCVGICENIPGSYTCSCPEGYRMMSDQRTCQDIDECAERGTTCLGKDDICINTRGKYRCQTVTCPNGFVRAASRGRNQRNNIRCQRRTFVCAQGDRECLYAPLSYSYNFITFPTKIRIPADLFTMRGPSSPYRRLDFELKMVSAKDPKTGITRVSRDFFFLDKVRSNEAIVRLNREISGPQDIELQLNMQIYSKEITTAKEIFFGTAVANITIFVTEEGFSSENKRPVLL
ncbi:unnamed protein product [Owenia fusiformis]|uniref:Fibulin-1 n=1 Tax=Owenia fusiformis TaxID=6347 RepID=A0A8J1T881_OWEFU|nr:unnamed protein product [Owenia fusiformis]